MKKVVCLESSLKRYLESLKSDGFTPGLLLGQSSPDKDYVVHVARTQAPKDTTNGTKFKKINELKEEYVMDHIRNVIQNLPGGMTVLGLFFVGENNLLNAAALSHVKNILNAMIKFQTENEFNFLDTNSNSKYVLHYVDSTNITCKRFSPSQGGNQFDVTECTFTMNLWHRITCYYDFEHLLPVYMETVSNSILQDKFMEILKYVSQSVRESVLLFNGEVKNKSELIKSIKEQSKKRETQNTSESDFNIPVSVDLYAPCTQQFSNTSSRISDYVAELKCFGTLCSDVYMHDGATVNEAIQAVKEDTIRSLYSRLTLHCNSLLEDLSSSALEETKIIHETPRRVSVILPYSKVCFTDYLFPGEDNVRAFLPAREQLDLRDVEDETTPYYELLEVETDATEFYGSDSVTNDVTNSSGVKGSHVSFTISIGIVLTLLVLIFAMFFQKLRSS